MAIARWNPRQTYSKQEEFLLRRLGRTRKLFAFLRAQIANLCQAGTLVWHRLGEKQYLIKASSVEAYKDDPRREKAPRTKKIGPYYSKKQPASARRKRAAR
jgi:hypothetical protein